MTDYSSVTHTGGLCGHEPVMSIIDEWPRFCGFHAAEYLAKWNAQTTRLSRLHKAYRNKKRGW